LDFYFFFWTTYKSTDQEKLNFDSLGKKIGTVSWSFFLVLLLGLFYFQWDIQRIEAVSDRLPSEKGKVLLTGWVSSPVRHLEGRLSFLLQGEYFQTPNEEVRIPGKIKFSIYDPETKILYGDHIQVVTRLKKPKGFINPRGFDYGLYQKRHGVIATASVFKGQEIQKIGNEGNPFLRTMAILREKVRESAISSLEGSDSGIFLAMILGERGGLNQEIRERFMASGTTHILSISGSHLGFVALVSFFIFRWALLRLPASFILRMGVFLIPTQWAALLTILPVTFYAFLAGGEVATLRALLMILISMVAICIQRADRLFNAFAIAILAILIWDPQALFDISFQLSYLSVFIILIALDQPSAEPEELEEEVLKGVKSRIKQVLDWAKKGMVLSFLITIGTAPLVLYYFNQFPWVGIFSNLIIGPFAGLVIVPLGLLSCVLALVMDSTLLPLAGLNQFFLSLFYELVTLFSSVPGGKIFLPSPPISIIFFYFVFFLAAIYWQGRWMKQTIAVCFASLLVWVWLGSAFTFPANGELQITFLDVGQGDGAVIRFPHGETMVVDGGAARGDFDIGRLVVAPYLWNSGIRHLNYVVVSHPQSDHEGGIPFLLNQFSIGEVWGNGYQRDLPFHENFEKVIEEKNLSYHIVSRGKKLTMAEETFISLLNPSNVVPVSNIPSNSRMNNNRSVVVRIQHGKHSFLFTGDIEKEGERDLVRSGRSLKTTVLKVPHHGSKGSVDPDFLNQVCPQVAVISVGGRNPYGHPAPPTLKAYDSLLSRIYRTDQDGGVMVKSDGENLRITRAVDLLLEPVKLEKGIIKREFENWRRVFL
jgi:competence protein ComEC